jgi:predicted DCC family thiol-disulfide oxidoreductase YuxK
MSDHERSSIILFDGVCNFCNGSVAFIIRRDPHKHFKFASLQSPAGQALLKKHERSPEQLDTLILIEEGKIYDRSTGALRIAKRLSGFWPGFYILIVIPAPIRDLLYNLVAKHRYNLFGKRDACMVPTADVRDRFVM